MTTTHTRTPLLARLGLLLATPGLVLTVGGAASALADPDNRR